MLARVWADHPDELRADFQQYYGLNIDGMGRDYSTLHAAALVSQMPEGSRLAQAYDPDALWTSERALMAAMVNSLNWLVWANSRDGERNRNRPKPIGPQAAAGRNRRVVGVAMTPDRLMAELNRIRKGARRG